MNTHHIDTHEFRDIKRYELLDRIDQNWTVRLKGSKIEWNKAGSVHTGNIPLKDLLEGQWEGYPPLPNLVLHESQLFLEKAISYTKHTRKSYFRGETWPKGRFIKWDSVKERFVHVIDYPKVDEDARVSFDGDMFAKATYELWLEEHS